MKDELMNRSNKVNFFKFQFFGSKNETIIERDFYFGKFFLKIGIWNWFFFIIFLHFSV